MQIEALKMFCDVAKHASFSKGAAENGVSQSTASETVQTLEEHLGVKLIDRSRRPLKLTAQGRLFHEGCRDLLGRYSDLVSRVQSAEPRDEVAGTVRVAAIYSVGLHGMTRHIDRFRRCHAAASCRLECMHPDRVVEAVRDGGADLGVISFPRKWSDLAVVPWRDEEMVVVMPPGHHLAEPGPIQVGSLDGQACVHFDADLVVRREIDRTLRRWGVHLESVLTFDNIENIKRAVEVGAGLAVLPRAAVGREEAMGTLVARPLADHRLCRPLAIVHRNDPGLSPAARAFLAELLSDLDGAAAVEAAARPAAGGTTPVPTADRN